MEKNYYEILEVDKNASEEIIKKAYNTLAKKYHPDLQPTNLKAQYEEKFKLINEAYEVLSVPQKRSLYDSSLQINAISQEDYDAICLENQKLKNIIYKLKQEVFYNQNNVPNIFQETYQKPATQHEDYIDNFEETNIKDYYIKQPNQFAINLKKRLVNFLSIIITVVILYLLWKIPFVKSYVLNILYTPLF